MSDQTTPTTLNRQTIVVCRHPEKDGDKITAKGAMQMWAMALLLSARFTFERAVYSGANRTLQALKVALAALGLDLPIEKNEGFHFKGILFEAFQTNESGPCLEEIKRITAKGGTVANALSMSVYATLGRDQMIESLRLLAEDMKTNNEATTLVLCHSPLTELAAVDPKSMPYSLGEADAVVYILEGNYEYVDGWWIVSSELIRSPLGGTSN